MKNVSKPLGKLDWAVSPGSLIHAFTCLQVLRSLLASSHQAQQAGLAHGNPDLMKLELMDEDPFGTGNVMVTGGGHVTWIGDGPAPFCTASNGASSCIAFDNHV